jgi:HYR domain
MESGDNTRGVRAARRGGSRKLPILAALLVTLAAAPAVEAQNARSLDTLNLDGVFHVTFEGAACPAGTPNPSHCYLWAGPGLVPGLGQTRESYLVIVDDWGSACAHAHWTWTATVTGKGEIEAAMQIPGCANQSSPDNVPATFTITGGSGTYAGATGSGTLASKPTETGFGSGTSIDTWRGTLAVSGLSFDTTPPTLTGARNLRLKAKTKHGVRAYYHLKASDPVDGSLPVTCHPRSGSRFRLGRTHVACNATDADGNTATAHFSVTVHRSGQ